MNQIIFTRKATFWNEESQLIVQLTLETWTHEILK
jgi:hypothetical protein